MWLLLWRRRGTQIRQLANMGHVKIAKLSNFLVNTCEAQVKNLATHLDFSIMYLIKFGYLNLSDENTLF